MRIFREKDNFRLLFMYASELILFVRAFWHQQYHITRKITHTTVHSNAYDRLEFHMRNQISHFVMPIDSGEVWMSSVCIVHMVRLSAPFDKSYLYLFIPFLWMTWFIMCGLSIAHNFFISFNRIVQHYLNYIIQMLVSFALIHTRRVYECVCGRVWFIGNVFIGFGLNCVIRDGWCSQYFIVFGKFIFCQ